MPTSVITIIATPGAADANSYLTLADAETILHARPHHETVWDAGALTDDQKKAALVWATRIISQYHYKGSPTYETTQALPWPRIGVYDNDGREFDDATIPEWLEVATAELAFNMIASDRLSDAGTEGFSKIELGSLKLTIDPKDRAKWIPEYIMKALRPYFAGTTSSLNFPVARA